MRCPRLLSLSLICSLIALISVFILAQSNSAPMVNQPNVCPGHASTARATFRTTQDNRVKGDGAPAGRFATRVGIKLRTRCHLRLSHPNPRHEAWVGNSPSETARVVAGPPGPAHRGRGSTPHARARLILIAATPCPHPSAGL
jgi:hypothetical protein